MAIETGAKAPDFTLHACVDEAPHTLSDALAHGPALIGIYKASCQASKTMFPMLERFRTAYADDGLTVFGVSQDSPNVTRSFTRRSGVTFPMLVEPKGYPVSHDYAIDATPSVFLIDAGGTIRWQGVGFQKPAVEELNATLAELLGVDAVDILEGADDIPGWVPG